MRRRPVWWWLFLVAGLLLAAARLRWLLAGEIHRVRLDKAGREALAAGRWEEALVAYAQLVERDPASAEARAQLDRAAVHLTFCQDVL